MPPGTSLEQAWDACRRGAWPEAYGHFHALDPDELAPGDLEAFADAAWWTLRLEESLGLRQRAFAGYAAAGRNRRAASAAWFLFWDYYLLREEAVASGWLARARRQLEGEEDCVEHGWLSLVDAALAHVSDDLPGARRHAESALATGRRLDVVDLVAMATQTLGRITISEGRVVDGSRLLDEAMSSAIARELSPLFTGWIFCEVLSACMSVADLRRAGEWSRAAAAWCDGLAAQTPYHGLCRAYRVELESLRGSWSEAEAQGLLTGQELLQQDPLGAAEAFYTVGEIRRKRGDATGAEDAFRRAHELGRDPQPGLALLRLAQGRAAAAESTLRLALAAPPSADRARADLLAAYVEAALASGRVDEARGSCDRLAALAEESPAGLVAARAASALAALQIAGGEPGAALGSARRALDWWQQLDVPYEAARARTLIGTAARLAGDDEGSRLELEAALATFERLGARTDARAVTRLLGGGAAHPRSLSSREVEVLRLVAQGKTNRGIAADLSLSEHTVSRHLQNIFTKLGVSSRAAATAFAFENDLVH